MNFTSRVVKKTGTSRLSSVGARNRHGQGANNGMNHRHYSYRSIYLPCDRSSREGNRDDNNNNNNINKKQHIFSAKTAVPLTIQSTASYSTLSGSAVFTTCNNNIINDYTTTKIFGHPSVATNTTGSVMLKSTLSNNDKDNNDVDGSSISSSDANNNENKDRIRKAQMKDAARKGSTAVKKGATSLRGLVQKYGWTFVGTYFTIYVSVLGTLFVSIDSGLIDPSTLSHIEFPWHMGRGATEESAADAAEFRSSVEIVAAYMKKFSWTEPYADLVQKNPHTSNLAIAWVATKLTEPIRIPITLAIVPRISRMMGQNPVDDGDDDVPHADASNVHNTVHDADDKSSSTGTMNNK